MTKKDLREATHVMGEMAAGRLFSLLHLRLEELREREDISYADIARRLGVSEQLVSRWLSEPRNMTVRSAGRLLAAMEAHLHFELDRYEDIQGANCAAYPAAKVVIHAAPQHAYLVPNLTLRPSAPVAAPRALQDAD